MQVLGIYRLHTERPQWWLHSRLKSCDRFVFRTFLTILNWITVSLVTMMPRLLKVKYCKVRWSAENIPILLFSFFLPYWHYLQHPGLDAMLAARPFCLSGGLRLISIQLGYCCSRTVQWGHCVCACICVCVSGQCLASSKFKLNLNEFLCVLGYGNCRNRLHTVTRQWVPELQKWVWS